MKYRTSRFNGLSDIHPSSYKTWSSIYFRLDTWCKVSQEVPPLCRLVYRVFEGQKGASSNMLAKGTDHVLIAEIKVFASSQQSVKQWMSGELRGWMKRLCSNQRSTAQGQESLNPWSNHFAGAQIWQVTQFLMASLPSPVKWVYDSIHPTELLGWTLSGRAGGRGSRSICY